MELIVVSPSGLQWMTGWILRLQELFLAEHVLLKSRDAAGRVERLLDDLPVSVDWTLEIPDVDVVMEIPTVTERRTFRFPELDVRIQILSHLQWTHTCITGIEINRNSTPRKYNIVLITSLAFCASSEQILKAELG